MNRIANACSAHGNTDKYQRQIRLNLHFSDCQAFIRGWKSGLASLVWVACQRHRCPTSSSPCLQRRSWRKSVAWWQEHYRVGCIAWKDQIKPTTRVPSTFHSVPFEGGLVQGWESVWWGVGDHLAEDANHPREVADHPSGRRKNHQSGNFRAEDAMQTI